MSQTPFFPPSCFLLAFVFAVGCAPSSQFLWCSNRGCRKSGILWICTGTCPFTQTTPSSGYYSVQTCYSAVTLPERAARWPSHGFGAHLWIFLNLWKVYSLHRELRLILLPALLLIQAFFKSICDCTSLVPLLALIRNCLMSVPSEPSALLWSAFQDLCVFPASPYTHFCTKDSHGRFLLNIIDPHSHRFCLMSTNAATYIS